jgi:two-component system response regulator
MAITEQYVGSVQIVVVEDNPDDALMTMRALRKLNPEPNVKLVRDGSDALAVLVGEGACCPELIFLDLKLPKVHGLEVLRLLRADPKASAIPVVILTSSDDPSDIAQAKQLGANQFVSKPIDWDQYSRLVREAAVKYLQLVVCKS